MMKYIITENRMVDVVEKFVHSYSPDFNRSCGKSTNGDGDNAYIMYFIIHDDGKIEIFARYYFNHRELALNRELFEMLESVFDEHMMTYVIDWFNKEFNQDAESVTF